MLEPRPSTSSQPNGKSQDQDEEAQKVTRKKTKTFKNILNERIPILSWLPNYGISLFLHDLLAGFSVALTEIPQGIAYAQLAGIPTEYGLYCGFMGGFFYMIFGSAKDVNIGPTSILSLMIQSHVAAMGVDMAILITFLAGCIILLFGLLHLGFVVEFFSYPIIAGFTSAAALTIASTQIRSLLGISGKADTFLDAIEFVCSHIKETAKWDAILGFTSIIFLIILTEIRRYGSLQHRPEWSRQRNIWGKCIFILSLSRNALVVIIGTLIAANVRDDGKVPVKITGTVTGGMPPFEAPPFSTNFNGTDYDFIDMAKEYGTTILFTPLVAILEAIAIAKAFSKGRKLDATQEMIALGICNIMGSFVRSMPVTGSFTRTAVNNASGVQTTVAGAVTAVFVILALQLITSSFYYIPKATLAAVIISSMFYLFDFQAFKLLWKSKKLDLIPFLVTLLCGVFISLEYGILIGIGTNLLFILYASARPKLQIQFIPQNNCYLLVPKGTIEFSGAEHLRDVILDCEGSGTSVVIDAKNIGNMDSTVARVLSTLNSELTLREQNLYIINLKEKLKPVCTGVDVRLNECFQYSDLSEINKDSNLSIEGI